MNRYIAILGCVGLAIAAFAGGVWFNQSQYPPKETASVQAYSVSAAATVAGTLGPPHIRSHSPILGPTNAPVTISQFFDPADEACRAFHPTIIKIMNAFPGKVHIAIRYTALHEPSKEAIAILEAARKQDKFIPVLEALFKKQSAWAPHGKSEQSPWDFLSETGLDIEQAKTAAKHPEVAALINQDTIDVTTLGVQQTPTFFVNGKPLQKFSAQALYDLVKQEVKKF